MTDKLLTLLLPFVGVLLGASLQYFYSRSAESRKQFSLLRSQAYTDFLRAVAKAAHAAGEDKRNVAFAEAADAKARIAIYGASAVLAKLAVFERAGASLSSEVAYQAFMSLCQEMRRESPGAAGVAQEDLRWVLFGPARFGEPQSGQVQLGSATKA